MTKGAPAVRVLLVPGLRLEGWKAMERYHRALAEALPRALPPGSIVRTVRDPDYPRWARFPARWLAYPRTIDWRGWDVVHVLDHSYAHVLRRRCEDTRTVVTVHDLFAFDPLAAKPGLRGFVLRRINRWVLEGLRRADACLCDSLATLRAVERHFPDVHARARHQPLAVDTRFFVDDVVASRQIGRTAMRLSDDDIVLLHVGSCVPRKNIASMLLALHRLSTGRSRLRLVQVGGRFRPEHRALIERLGLSPRVQQLPQIDEELLPHVYAAADVVVMPSLFEGFGLPVLEAFAVGVPVVTTRNGSLAEFPPSLLATAGAGSAEEIETAVRAVLDDRPPAAARATYARGWARQWTWDRVARGAANAYGAER